VNTSRLLWLVSLLLTLVFGYWQRVSGPTWPLSGRAPLAGGSFAWRLERTHAGAGDHVVVVRPGAAGATGALEWREHGAPSAWTRLEMRRAGDALIAALPHRAPGGKLDYRVRIGSGGTGVTLPPGGQAVLRFRNDVPAWVLIPHIVCMLGALALGTRAALEAFRREPRLKGLTLRTIAALFLGGFPLGCAVSAYAFGRPWGGFPLGNDATDDKTLIAFLGWLAAGVAVFTLRRPRGWVVAAALLMLVVYLIPHSFAPPR